MAFRCKSLSLVGFAQGGGVAALPLYCRRWQCPDCGKFQRRRLRKRLLTGQPTTFITLTVNPRLYPDPDEAFKQASRAINKLLKVLRRRFKAPHIEYGLVWERTKKGYPHAHLLLRAPFIPQALLSFEWRRLSGAKIVDIRMVRTEGEAASYVSKYLAKDPAVPPGYRRYRLSRAYSAAPPKSQLADALGITRWDKSPIPLTETIGRLQSYGWQMHEWLPELYVSAPGTGPPGRAVSA